LLDGLRGYASYEVERRGMRRDEEGKRTDGFKFLASLPPTLALSHPP
jgi:hypothetical protein